MSKTLRIFLPDKHYYNVETNDNTLLFQILEKVCLEKGYSPVENYSLSFNKKQLDLALPLCYVKIPNHSELELIHVSAPVISRNSVLVALSFGPRRESASFFSDVTLFGILRHFITEYPGWIEQPNDQHPVLVYMRQEIVGELALEHTKLQQLGLGSSGGLLRLLFRQVDSAKLAAIEASIVQKNENKKEHLAASISQQAIKQNDLKQQDHSVTSQPVTQQQQQTLEPLYQPSTSAGSDASLYSAFREVPKSKQPPAPKPQTLAAMLGLSDFSFDSPSQNMITPSSGATSAPVPFKFPEETAGQDLYRNELSDVNLDEYKPCDRCMSVYRTDQPLPSESKNMELDEPDDDFFEVTTKDLQKMVLDLRSKVQSMVDAPVMSKALREQQELEAYRHYTHAIVRLHFPEKVTVQALFRPMETVHALLKFVRTCLANPDRNDVYLYTTPPKIELKDPAQTLIHASLVPLSHVRVGFRNEQSGSSLRENLVIASLLEADKIVYETMKSMLPEPSVSNSDNSKKPASASGGSSGVSASAAKAPKWLKLSK